MSLSLCLCLVSGAASALPEAAGAQAAADHFRAEEAPASEGRGGETGGTAEDGPSSEGSGGTETPQQWKTW